MDIARLVNYAEPNTFSLLFFTGSFFAQYYYGNFSITVAGLEWINVGVPSPWVYLMFAIFQLFFYYQ